MITSSEIRQVANDDEMEVTETDLDPVVLSNGEYWDIGDPTWLCEHCGALMWYAERLHKRWNTSKPKFSLCCLQGKIELPILTDTPHTFRDLFFNNDARSNFFLEHIRSFNSMFSFTSMGGRVDKTVNDGNAPPQFIMCGENYHRIGSLVPTLGSTPKFAQLYIYGTQNEVSNRMRVVSMEDDINTLHAAIVSDIKDMLDLCNPYAKSYRMIRDRLQCNDLPNMKLRLIGKRGRDGRRYNLPAASEVAALIVGDFDFADADRDIIVETQSGLLQRVSLLNPAYLPLQYPLLFPRGEDGYRDDVSLKDNSKTLSNKRQKVSMREFFAYRIQDRDHEQSMLLHSKSLFQQFLVDGYSMIESARLTYIRTHQKELRAEMYKGLSEAILRGEFDPSATGKCIIFPTSFTGGARYMIQNYQDAMAICRWVGYPDLFITFACNQNWTEITRLLSKKGLRPEDRPDIICQVFKMKLDQLIKEIKQGNIFGKVKSVIYTIEFQKRGLPHAHILIFLHPDYKYPNPEDIDKINIL